MTKVMLGGENCEACGIQQTLHKGIPQPTGEEADKWFAAFSGVMNEIVSKILPNPYNAGGAIAEFNKENFQNTIAWLVLAKYAKRNPANDQKNLDSAIAGDEATLKAILSMSFNITGHAAIEKVRSIQSCIDDELDKQFGALAR